MKKKIEKIGKLPPSTQKAALEKLQKDTKEDLQNGTAQGPSTGKPERLE